MSVKFTIRQSFTVPATSAQYAPELITLAQGNTAGAGKPALLGVTALLEAAVAGAIVELWLLKVGGDPTASGDYFNSGKNISSGADTWPLASWPGAQLRVKSGGTAGTAIVNATADE